jgi:enterochelin esterase-like enzyme
MKSRILREFQSSYDDDGDTLRREVARVLQEAGGPLIELDDAESGEYTVTFVAVGPTKAPVVRSPIFRTADWQHEMQHLPGTTDVWWTEASTSLPNLRTTYRFLSQRVERQNYDTGDDAANRAAENAAVFALGYPDPFNPRQHYPSSAFGMGIDVPGDKWDSVLVLPAADESPWVDDLTESGLLETFCVHSAVLGNERRVSVWTPASTSATTPLPLVILLDGEDLLCGVRAPALFDTLVRKGVVPPFRAAFVANPTITSRMSEYACNLLFMQFIAEELFPTLCSRYAHTGGQASTVIGGFSYGGLASLWVAFSRPDIFGGAVASSPSLWWGPGVRVSANPEGAPASALNVEWLTHQYSQSPRKPLRLWIDVGLLESAPLPFAGGADMLSSCRRFREVLEAKGYEVIGYREQPCGHEYLGWREGLASGLIAFFSHP